MFNKKGNILAEIPDGRTSNKREVLMAFCLALVE